MIGGTSFVATHALPRLVAQGASVFATRRGRVPAIPGVQWVTGDLTSQHGAAVWPARCDAVVYLAQGRGWRDFPDGARDVFAVNVDGVMRALEYARGAGVGRFIFASSGSVYSATDAPAREHDAIDLLAPRSFYSASKLAAEMLIGSYRSVFHTIVLRLFVPYGPGQAADMLIPRMVESVRAGQPITLQGDAGLVMNPVAVEDVADALVRCLSLDASATLNVAGPETLTLRQVGEAIGRAIGRAPRFEHRPGAAAAIVGDTTLLRNTMGWAPPITFEDGLHAWLGSKP